MAWLREADREIFEHEFQEFLPETLFDSHVHIWLEAFLPQMNQAVNPSLPRVVKEWTVEELEAFYREVFPGKEVFFLLFGMPDKGVDLKANNDYVASFIDGEKRFGLLLTSPIMPLDEIRRSVEEQKFCGYKPYWTLVPGKEQNEVTIFDMVREDQWVYANERGLVVVLHIPRKMRLRDPLNFEQLRSILAGFPKAKLVLAHGGRSYCLEHLEEHIVNSLRKFPNLFWDVSAIQNESVLEFLFRRIAPERIIFGSDMPIALARGRMVCVNAQNVFVTEEAFPWSFSNPALGYRFTFMLYESIRSVKRACQRVRWSSKEVERIFYSNAYTLVKDVWETLTKGGGDFEGKAQS